METPSTGRPSPLPTIAVAAASLLAAIALPGCFSDSEGLNPPQDQLYFPTNLIISPGKQALYVTNSDFDLQYNGGTVQALDLEAIRGKARLLQDGLDQGSGSGACGSVGLATSPQPILYPGPCGPLELPPFVKSSATIGAFAHGASYVLRPKALQSGSADGTSTARLFVSVAGDPSITYFDVPDDSDASTATPPSLT